MNDRTRLPEKDSYDVVVMGGGPAGTTAATLVAQGGRDVLLVDRETFPRFRIGESLMPATYWTLERLGMLGKLHRSPFPKKASVQFFSKSGRSSAPFYFTEVDAHESSMTWQVDRAEFDRLLLEHSVETGVEVREGVAVREVLFEGERATGVRLESADGSRRDVSAKVVVDATGQSALISRKLGLREVDPKLRHISMYTRYRGARRDPGIDGGATLIFWTREQNSWFWFIPLPDDVVSVGVVGPVEHLTGGRLGDPQAVFDEELAACPALVERLANAERFMDTRVIRDFSYISSRIAGDGWVMAGDAFGFLDPIYSTGVFFALKSAELAADSILDAFRHDDFSGGRLGRHGDRYLAGMEAMRRLVYAYYDRDFSFARFLERHPGHRDTLVNLLIGNVFRVPVDGIFQSMGEMCELPEARRIAPSENPA